MNWPSTASVTISSTSLVGGSGGKRQLCDLCFGLWLHELNKLRDVRAVHAENQITYRVLLCTEDYLSPLYQCCWLHCICNMLHPVFVHAPGVVHWFQLSLTLSRLSQSVYPYETSPRSMSVQQDWHQYHKRTSVGDWFWPDWLLLRWGAPISLVCLKREYTFILSIHGDTICKTSTLWNACSSRSCETYTEQKFGVPVILQFPQYLWLYRCRNHCHQVEFFFHTFLQTKQSRSDVYTMKRSQA